MTINPELTQDIIGKVESALNAIAAKIGVGIDHFWPIFVRQQIIEGIGVLVTSGELPDVFCHIFNPEYNALQDVFKMVK